MMKIFKYVLSGDSKQIVIMPDGATILTIQLKDSSPCLWALVNTNNMLCERVFITLFTGEIIESYYGEYVATYQMQNLVHHVFDKGYVF